MVGNVGKAVCNVSFSKLPDWAYAIDLQTHDPTFCGVCWEAPQMASRLLVRSMGGGGLLGTRCGLEVGPKFQQPITCGEPRYHAY